MSARQDFINVAKSQVGYTATSTTGKFCDWYGMRGYWCAMFVSWCASQAGIIDTLVPRHAYTPAGANWFAAKGRWNKGTAGIKPGDVVYFCFGGQRIDHVGIFISWKNGLICTIDGNTGSANGRIGGCVRYATRYPHYVVGYGSLGEAAENISASEENFTQGILEVDGYWGADTTKALQKLHKLDEDGIVKSQEIFWKNANPALASGWEWIENPKGSALIAKLQSAWGVENPDGLIGENTVKAMQRYYRVEPDGFLGEGSLTVKRMQSALNKQLSGGK